MKKIVLVAVALFACFAGVVQAQAVKLEDRLAQGRHSADVNGVKFWYAVRGAGPLLIVQAPGWGIGSEYLQNGLAPLEAHFTLVFYDTRGSGQSGRPADEKKMSTSDMVDDLEGLRQYWRLPRISVLGHSHGGAIALGYAIRYPKRVEKLILVDSNIQDFNEEAIVQKELETRKGDKRFEAAIAEAMKPWPNLQLTTDQEFGASLARVLPLYFYDPDKYAPLLEKTAPSLPSVWANHANAAADAKPMIKEDGRMNRVRARTLLLVGQNDWICSPAIAERIHAAIRGSKIRIFERTGHFPWIEDSDEFFRDVTRFAGGKIPLMEIREK
ncbi:MAG: alpha/beta fold hydrolase [Candidatus Acidiferrales bacterium]